MDDFFCSQNGQKENRNAEATHEMEETKTPPLCIHKTNHENQQATPTQKQNWLILTSDPGSQKRPCCAQALVSSYLGGATFAVLLLPPPPPLPFPSPTSRSSCAFLINSTSCFRFRTCSLVMRTLPEPAAFPPFPGGIFIGLLVWRASSGE